MPTTDKNGVVQLQTNDLITPFQSAINSVSGSISNVLTTLKKDIIYKATNQNNAIAKKNALIEQGIVGTPNAPLLFYFTNLNTLYEWDGSSWNQIAPEPNTIVVDGVEYRRSGRATFASAWVDVVAGALWRSEELVININQTPPPGWHYAISCSVDSGGINLLVGRSSYTKTDKPRIVFFSPAKLDRLKIHADWHLEADQ